MKKPLLISGMGEIMQDWFLLYTCSSVLEKKKIKKVNSSANLSERWCLLSPGVGSGSWQDMHLQIREEDSLGVLCCVPVYRSLSGPLGTLAEPSGNLSSQMNITVEYTFNLNPSKLKWVVYLIVKKAFANFVEIAPIKLWTHYLPFTPCLPSN